MTIKYKNVYERKNLDFPKTEPGDHFMNIYKWRVDDDGNMIRKIVKTENIYDRIQAARDSVDLNKILERYENGDASALQKVQGMYIDTTELPKTYHELYKAVQIHNDAFNSMPVEIKQAFDNNPAKFWKEFGTDKFDAIINDYRQMVYDNYGMEDPEPVQTAAPIKEGDVNVEKPE